MRPYWERAGQGSAELEALQTDVMRFIAIIGLCLAAIFSLVNGAHEQVRAPEEVAHELTPETRAMETAVEPELVVAAESPTASSPRTADKAVPPEPEPRPRPEAIEPESSPPPPPQEGFSLEFASDDALRSLLASGLIQLYAGSDDAFWRVRREGGFQATEAPASYYIMQPETVPQRLRLQLEGLGVEEPVSWGVTLPRATTGEIRALMRGRRGGSLLIAADASVSLE